MGTKENKIIGFVLAILIIIILFVVFNNKSSKINPANSGQNQRETQSITLAEKAIRDTLKYPKTATFENVHANEISNSKNVWNVNGYVNSENDSGTKTRNIWEVQIDYRGSKEGIVSNITFNGEYLK